MYFTFRCRRGILLSVLLSVLLLCGAVCVTAMAAEREKVCVPILMYHSVLKDEKMLGKYVITPGELEEDMNYLRENGYTPITPSDLVAYIEKKGELPEKPVMLTFDDGYYNNYVYAYPLAQKYDTKILIAPIGLQSERYSQEGVHLSAYYSHVSWGQIQEMWDSGLVEFANHSYNLHESSGARLGTKQLAGESDQDYRNMLTEDVGWLQDKLEQLTGQSPCCFVYPFGAVSQQEPDILQDMGFQVTLGCEEKVNVVTRDPASLCQMGRYLRTHNRSAEQILSGLTL